MAAAAASAAAAVNATDVSQHSVAAQHVVAAQPAKFVWTPVKVVQSLALFVLAGVAEIGGGWLMWQCVREHKPWYWGLFGAAVLCAYGLVPTLQPTGEFGRVYAVYGGFFIALSLLWGWAVDGVRPDVGDWVGMAIALVGVLLCWFWPR